MMRALVCCYGCVLLLLCFFSTSIKARDKGLAESDFKKLLSAVEKPTFPDRGTTLTDLGPYTRLNEAQSMQLLKALMHVRSQDELLVFAFSSLLRLGPKPDLDFQNRLRAWGAGSELYQTYQSIDDFHSRKEASDLIWRIWRQQFRYTTFRSALVSPDKELRYLGVIYAVIHDRSDLYRQAIESVLLIRSPLPRVVAQMLSHMIVCVVVQASSYKLNTVDFFREGSLWEKHFPKHPYYRWTKMIEERTYELLEAVVFRLLKNPDAEERAIWLAHSLLFGSNPKLNQRLKKMSSRYPQESTRALASMEKRTDCVHAVLQQAKEDADFPEFFSVIEG